MLDIVASYHCTHFQGKLINQMAKKPKFRPDFGTSGPDSGCQNFVSKNLAPSVTRHHSELS